MALNWAWHARQLTFSFATPVVVLCICVGVKLYTDIFLEEQLKFLRHGKTRMMDAYNFTNKKVTVLEPSYSTLEEMEGEQKLAVVEAEEKPAPTNAVGSSSSSSSNNDITVSADALSAEASAATTTTTVSNRNSKKEDEALTIYEDIKLLHRDIDRIELELTSIYLELLYKRQERAFFKNKNVIPYNNSSRGDSTNGASAAVGLVGGQLKNQS